MASAAERLVNVHQAKTHLSQLLQEVEQGQEVPIARAGVPIARPGAMRGQIELAEDFDAPLADLFEVLLLSVDRHLARYGTTVAVVA